MILYLNGNEINGTMKILRRKKHQDLKVYKVYRLSYQYNIKTLKYQYCKIIISNYLVFNFLLIQNLPLLANFLKLT